MGKNDIKKYQIKKGQVLNPKGRGKGVKNMKTLLRTMLDKKTREAIINALIKNAKKDSDVGIRAFNAIMDRLYGKPDTKIDMNNNITYSDPKLIYEDKKVDGFSGESEDSNNTDT